MFTQRIAVHTAMSHPGLRLGRRRSTRTSTFDFVPPTIVKRRSHSVSDSSSLSHMSDLIEISLSVRDLQSAQTSRDDRIVCVVYENDTDNEDNWRLVGCSKPQSRYSNNISITEKFSLKYVFERTQLVKVNICSYNPRHSPSRLSENVIGCCIFKLDELTGSFGLQLRKKLHRDFPITSALTTCRILSPPVGGLFISGQIPDKDQPIVIQFAGKGLEKKEMFWDETAVFFRVFRVEENEDTERVLLYESEALKNHSHPQWRTFNLPTREVADDRNRLLEVWVYYRDVDNTEGVIGKFLTTYAKMKYGAGPDNVYNVINDTKKMSKKHYDHSGKMELTKFTDVSFYSFLDYIVSGTQLHFEIAVDFSNHDLLNEFERQKFDSDFQTAIRAIGGILRDYSPNRLFPAFGFGAKVPPTFQESHEFCLNFAADPACRGLDGVMEAYRKATPLIRASDHACYAPIINYVTRMAKSAASGLHYHVLCIFTKGKSIHDHKETLSALLSAADAPLSIVFIGIGTGDFSTFHKLASKKKPSQRDAIEFVDLNELIDPIDTLEENKSRIAEQTLHAVPKHMVMHMHQKNIAAKPPIQACRSPLFHSSFLIPDRPTEFHMDEIPSFRGTFEEFANYPHSPRSDRRGSDYNCKDMADRFRDTLSVRMPERSHSVLQTSREQYQRKLIDRSPKMILPATPFA